MSRNATPDYYWTVFAAKVHEKTGRSLLYIPNLKSYEKCLENGKRDEKRCMEGESPYIPNQIKDFYVNYIKNEKTKKEVGQFFYQSNIKCMKCEIRSHPSSPLRKCGGCEIFYCGLICQREDWGAHKIECSRQDTTKKEQKEKEQKEKEQREKEKEKGKIDNTTKDHENEKEK